MSKPINRNKYKRRKNNKSKFKTFLLLFLALCILLFAASHLYNNGERAYPRPNSYLVAYYCADYGLESNLVYAIMKQESGFDEDAVSPKGAKGLMQLMPDTAQWAASKIGIDYDESKLTEPAYNIRLGTWYLSYLSQEFSGDITKVLAAYNAGDGNVTAWLADGVWDGTLANAASIPFPETANYVVKVTENLENYRELYG